MFEILSACDVYCEEIEEDEMFGAVGFGDVCIGIVYSGCISDELVCNTFEFPAQIYIFQLKLVYSMSDN